MPKTQVQIDWYNRWRKTPEGKAKMALAGKKWREANKEKLLSEARDKNLKNLYGISEKDWEELFDSQGRVCAICSGDKHHGRNWHTDHDHLTGQIRGILCSWCNTALGKFQEDSKIMMAAISYINQKYK